jgi:hypothetical protein
MPHAAQPNRRRLLGGVLALCGALFTISACSNDDTGSDTTPCTMDTGASEISGNLAVHYEASATGNGTLSSVTYATDAGDQVVVNPSLPWEVDVTLATAHARLRAAGRLNNGVITIQYQADGGPGNVEQDETTCAAE